MTTQIRWWGMTPGDNHSADALFTSASVLGIDYLGDKNEGNLSDLVGASVEQVHKRFKQSLLRRQEPDVKDTRYHAGNIHRFLTELAIGDIVVFRTILPEETRGTVHVVRVVDGYTYRPKAVQGFVHQRPTKPITTFAGSELPDEKFAVINARHTIWELGDEARTALSRLIADSR
jgi:predicted Mrr-cat superfamily restriction endonuclease